MQSNDAYNHDNRSTGHSQLSPRKIIFSILIAAAGLLFAQYCYADSQNNALNQSIVDSLTSTSRNTVTPTKDTSLLAANPYIGGMGGGSLGGSRTGGMGSGGMGGGGMGGGGMGGGGMGGGNWHNNGGNWNNNWQGNRHWHRGNWGGGNIIITPGFYGPGPGFYGAGPGFYGAGYYDNFNYGYRYPRYNNWVWYSGMIPTSAIVIGTNSGRPVYSCSALVNGRYYNGSFYRGRCHIYINNDYYPMSRFRVHIQ